MVSGATKREHLAVKGKIEIGQGSRIYKMQDIYVDANESMVMKLKIPVER